MSDIELTTPQFRKIKNAVNTLNKLKDEIQKENPDAYINWYLQDGDNLHLMSGDSHTDGITPNYHHVIESFYLKSASGGGW